METLETVAEERIEILKKEFSEPSGKNNKMKNYLAGFEVVEERSYIENQDEKYIPSIIKIIDDTKLGSWKSASRTNNLKVASRPADWTPWEIINAKGVWFCK